MFKKTADLAEVGTPYLDDLTINVFNHKMEIKGSNEEDRINICEVKQA